MGYISQAAETFMGWFYAGGAIFLEWVTDIVPMIICLMTAVGALIKLIGTERVERFAGRITRHTVLRYTLLPVMAVLFLGNPMCYSFGKFVEEKHKPAYYDACVSFLHPVTGLFPHANPGELFVYTGIAAGLKKAGFLTTDLAVRYFLTGIVVILIRGIVTERIYARITEKNGREES